MGYVFTDYLTEGSQSWPGMWASHGKNRQSPAGYIQSKRYHSNLLTNFLCTALPQSASAVLAKKNFFHRIIFVAKFEARGTQVSEVFKFCPFHSVKGEPCSRENN